jgi:hypothetical protein
LLLISKLETSSVITKRGSPWWSGLSAHFMSYELVFLVC